MKGELVIISVNGTLHRTPLTAPPSLEALQQGVGGFIEVVPTFKGFEGRPGAMFCNEEGKLKGLPVNVRATELTKLYPHDVLVGDVVVITGDQELMEEL